MTDNRTMYPTVTSIMYKPLPDLRKRWLKQYGKDKFTFEEALYAQSFPNTWIFPEQKSRRWKWIAEAFPPKVSEYLLRAHVGGSDNVLLDLFAGIGGWSLGAFWSGKFKKIIMVEKDREKCKFLDVNFSILGIDYEVICRDVRDVDYSAIGRVDVVVGSPPCEDLSPLRFFGKDGIKTFRGTIPLTVFMLDVVDSIKPRVALYENVYRIKLKELVHNRGWVCQRLDMSFIIPQKRVRLICTKRLYHDFF